MTPWANPASYQERPVVSDSAEKNAAIVDEILAMLGEPIPDEPMDRTSKLVLLGCAFAMGVFIALQIGG
ncbi:hypothetical protein [Rhizorhapis sp.]|uniref:hypothetical protein n=1 Tax=Rhizorhapis sp. TaxID=1968842 RepID=UPI002B4630D3|nr:hypothetical protein [Rhizorhapis sp.]HKR17628.1 hypothetical protein [Rhizorhapis sp.]